jgi:tRNA dimethylallyltransferase
MNFSGKRVIIICGPTAVGKTAVAIALAKHFSTEIISADSRQCYKELNIGVARPSESELKEVPHHFIASNSVREEINAAFFERYALQKTGELFQQHNVIIMAGGTGLYIKAFCEGLDEIPEVSSVIRNTVIENYSKHGLSWLQQQVEKKDPEFFAKGEIQNPQRVMRALEVMEATGQSILSFRKNKKAQRDFSILKIGLELPKEELHQNINSRVDKMIGDGLVEEVKALQEYSNMNALQTVGYTEIFNYLNGKLTLAEAAEEIRKNTRQYAKRQLTWFRKDKEIEWFEPSQLEEIAGWAAKKIPA